MNRNRGPEQKETSKSNTSLRDARIEAGLSQDQLAEKLLVETKTVSRWERGKTHPHPPTAKQLSDILGKSLKELGLSRIPVSDEKLEALELGTTPVPDEADADHRPVTSSVKIFQIVQQSHFHPTIYMAIAALVVLLILSTMYFKLDRSIVPTHPAPPTATTITLNIAAYSTPLVSEILVGKPIVALGDYTSQERANGTASYTFSAQIVNKADNTPITATDVTCRLWLTTSQDATDIALNGKSADILQTPDAFTHPFPSEVGSGLAFLTPSQQVQPCVANGKTTWTYTISPTVPQGTYYLAVLADWRGEHYNWHMVRITVLHGNA